MIALLLAAALGATTGTLTSDALRARYGGLRSLSADVVQVKEGRFWARPLESRIRLRYTPERIVWETISPFRSSVVIEGGRLTVLDASGRARDVGGLSGDPRVTALVRFIRSLIAVDLDAIDREFTIRYGPGELVAVPREGSALKLFTSIRLRFDDRDDLTAMEIETPNERTRLAFERVEREPPAPARAERR